MKKENILLVMLGGFLAGLVYWLDGYQSAGYFILFGATLLTFVMNKKRSLIVLLFLGMVQFTLFSLVGTIWFSTVVQSEFECLYLFISCFSAGLLMYSLSLNTCLFDITYRKIKPLSKLILILFIIIACIISNETLNWVGYPIMPTLSRTELVAVLAFVFVPIVIIPDVVILSKIMNKKTVQQNTPFPSKTW